MRTQKQKKNVANATLLRRESSQANSLFFYRKEPTNHLLIGAKRIRKTSQRDTHLATGDFYMDVARCNSGIGWLMSEFKRIVSNFHHFTTLKIVPLLLNQQF